MYESSRYLAPLLGVSLCLYSIVFSASHLFHWHLSSLARYVLLGKIQVLLLLAEMCGWGREWHPTTESCVLMMFVWLAHVWSDCWKLFCSIQLEFVQLNYTYVYLCVYSAVL